MHYNIQNKNIVKFCFVYIIIIILNFIILYNISIYLIYRDNVNVPKDPINMISGKLG